MRSMRWEKVAGALQRPKGTWLNSKSWPLLVRKAIFSMTRSGIGTCQYPLLRSRVDTDVEEAVDAGKGMWVFDSGCVELPKVNAEAQVAVLFLDHNNW